MRLKSTVFFAVIGLAMLCAPAAFADGEVCSGSQKKEAEGALRKAEDAENAGRTKEAYDAAQSLPMIDCAANGYKRRDGLIERTSKKLGTEAEKTGRFGEAFEYYSAPHRHGRLDYPLANADRAMLKNANANPDDYKVVSQAVHYFDSREGKPHFKEVSAIVKRGGDKMLAKEEKTFAALKDSLNDLQQAGEWLNLIGDKQAQARGEQRGDTLLADDSRKSLELAISYYQFAGNDRKVQQVRDKARRLGDVHIKKDEKKIASEYYAIAGLSDKASELLKAHEAEKEKTEEKRQKQFKKEQESLEKELGL